MSRDERRPLRGRSGRATGAPDGPARWAGALLRLLGADIRYVTDADHEELSFGGHAVALRMEGSDAGAGAPIVDDALAPPRDILRTYAGLRLAGTVLERADTLDLRQLLDDLVEGMIDVGSRMGPQLYRCADGWVVTRWRDEEDERLFVTLFEPVDDRLPAKVREVVRRSREVRLLVAPVAAPVAYRPLVPVFPTAPTSARGAELRVVDFSPLWAGPWLTAQLVEAGHEVIRVEAPHRRDGLFRTEQGRRLWTRLNDRKVLELVDASTASGRSRLRRLVSEADVLVTGVTPRVLPQLGLSDGWLARRGGRLFHIELVAYEAPWSDYPGLGEHAAASAGLLWTGNDPRRPLPWSDPLLAAWGLVLIRAWRTAGASVPGRLRLSLEAAARLTFARLPGFDAGAAPGCLS